MSWLELEISARGDESGERRWLSTETPIVIGRDASARVRLNHGNVARRHCAILSAPSGALCVKDLGSTNGTRLNGWTVQVGPYAVGDTLFVGDYRVTLIDIADDPPPSAN